MMHDGINNSKNISRIIQTRYTIYIYTCQSFGFATYKFVGSRLPRYIYTHNIYIYIHVRPTVAQQSPSHLSHGTSLVDVPMLYIYIYKPIRSLKKLGESLELTSYFQNLPRVMQFAQTFCWFKQASWLRTQPIWRGPRSHHDMVFLHVPPKCWLYLMY